VTTIDLHPEEMLDAARRGTLGVAATDDLRAHLARCAACRVSLTLADDLRAEAAVTNADGTLLASMVRGALADEPHVAYDMRAHRARASSGRRVAVAIALLLLGGSGGAAVYSMGGAAFVRRFVPEILQLPRRQHAPVAAPRAISASLPAVAAPAPAPVEEPVAPVAPPAPASVPPTRSVRARVETPALPADDLFADANRARRAGDYPRALRRYAELRRAYPGSRQEMTARVVVGDLQLEEGPSRDALASFDSYLAANPAGTLAEEARVGRAVALGRLGRRAEEREAWSQLLREHPNSVQGARARRRLAELR
jgi:TolA-binding protein